MAFRESEPLAPHTTFRIGGVAAFFMDAESEDDIREALALASEQGRTLRVLGGGSNILVPDEGVDAIVLHMCMRGIDFLGIETATLVAGAGESWDAVVDAAAAQGLWGIENLAGIPGTVGGAVVQNIGAYGAELAEAFLYADTIDVSTGAEKRITHADAAFGYRTSRFKGDHSLVITRAAFNLSKAGAAQAEYADLARAASAGVPLDTPRAVARAVRAIRAQKFPDLALEGTAGSFFKNPVLSAERAAALARKYPELPQFPQAGGEVKVPLAWLLDRALSLKGFSSGAARAFEHQPLVIVAKAGARASDVEALAREIATRVREATGIELEREVETFGA